MTALTSNTVLEKYVINPVMVAKNISFAQAIVLTKIPSIYASSELNVTLKWSAVKV